MIKHDELIRAALVGYQAERERITENIDTLRAQLKQTKPTSRQAAPAKRGRRPKRTLSAEGRERIAAALRKRWAMAKKRGINAVTGKPLS